MPQRAASSRSSSARVALALALALAGCVAPGGPRPSVPGASEAPKASTAPRTGASTKPVGPASSPGASAAPKSLVAAALVRPAAGAASLGGRIQADAAYMRTTGRLIGADGGSLIGADGGSLVAAGAGNIVAAGAGNAVAVTGDDLAAKGGVGIVAGASGSILAAGAGSLIGADGGSLIGADGGSLIGADGGSLIGADGGSYRLAQAAAPAAGRQVAIAGMLVSVVSLAKREYLPIGETPDGKKVYTVYTDAAGGFSVSLPPSEDANVLVVASLPGRQEAGTILNAITPPAAADVAVDEDTATVTRYMRRALVNRLADLVAAPTLDEARSAIARDVRLGEGARTLFNGVAEAFNALGAARGLAGLADRELARAQARVITAAVIDDVLARVDLGTVLIDQAISPRWADAALRVGGLPLEGARAQDALLLGFRELRARAAAKMATPAGGYAPLPAEFFARVALGSNPETWVGPSADWTDWFAEILERHPTGPYAITKPAEAGDFLVDRYFGVNRNFISEPPLAAFVMLDPKTYPADTRFPAAGEPFHAEATAMLARINQRLGITVTPNDAQFNGNAREANRAYVESINAAGLALFMQVGLAVTTAPERARAVAGAVALPTAAD